MSYRGIHGAIKIPDHDRTQRRYELESINFEKSPMKSENIVLIEITMSKGRSLESKKILSSKIVKNLSKLPGIDWNDIIIVIHEPPLKNLGIRGGKLPSEENLGFKINV